MADAGRKFTDKQIAEIEKQLKKEYQTALKEMQEKSIKVLEQFEKNDKKMVAKVNSKEITYGQYREWRKKNMLKTKQTEGLIKDLTERVVHSDEIAADYINQRIPAVYSENYNFATYDIENQMRIDTKFTLMSEDAVSGLVTGRTPIFPIANVNIPKDMRWNEKKIRSALTQGLLQGESVQKVAKRLQKVTDMDRNAATRNARTMMGRAQNTGRMESIKRAHNLGLPVKKMWIATLDSRTRDSHVNLDGEIREYDEPFSNGLDHPHGMGDPAEVYNCFIGDTQVAVDSDILRGYRHPYDGEVISIETATGVKFTCTPNHPILTPRGWVKVNALNDGEDLLVANIGDKHFSRRNPYVNHVFARFDTLFKLLEKLSSQRTCNLSVDFHGDVSDTNVEIVTKKGFLRNDRNTVFGKKINEILLKCTNSAVFSDSTFMKHFGSICLTTLCNISRLDQALAFFLRGLGHSQVHGLGTVTGRYTLFPKSLANSSSVNIKAFSELINRKSRVVKIDKIINIEIKSFHGYVYNLQTDDNYYFVNNSLSHNGYFAIAHNCRCDMRPIYKGQKFDASDLGLRNTDKLGSMSYEDWKNEHKRHEWQKTIRKQSKNRAKTQKKKG